MYFPKISNSTFTISLFFKFFKLVSFKVWGITLISKNPLTTLEIVNETPLIEIEAFSIKYLFNFLFSSSNFIIQVLWTIVIFLILAVESTCPWT